MATVKLERAITKRKNRMQLWTESLMIGEYDHRTVKGRKDMEHDIEITKKVLGYQGIKVVVSRSVHQQV